MRWWIVAISLGLGVARAEARDWFVAVGGTGDGSISAPFGAIQDGIDAAMTGDVIVVAAGTYAEALQTRRAGVTVRGNALGDVVVTVAGRVLTIAHINAVFENLVFDAQYADDDAVRIEDGGHQTVLQSVEVRRATRDCIDIGAPDRVVIQNALIHHCLNAAGGRTDAHGIVGGAVHDLTIHNTTIHTFSGDAVQLDPGRSAPGWDRVTINGCRMWLEPLPAPENGFPAGVVPGENAVDTKVMPGTLPTLVITDSVAHGFRGGLIGNMAAFNLKESVAATVDRVTIFDSEIALRLRAPADVVVTNAVIYDVDTAVRYEDGIIAPRLWASTIGGGVGNAFVEASSASTVIDGRDVLIIATALPPELANGNSLAVDTAGFVDATTHNYHLTADSPARDVGRALDEVPFDRDGIPRTWDRAGLAPDIGAYEYYDPTIYHDVVVGQPTSPGGCCDGGRGSGPSSAALVLIVVALAARRGRLI